MNATTILAKSTSLLAALGMFACLQACKSSDDDKDPGGSGGTGGQTQTSTSTPPAAKVVINELQPANKDTVTDEHGDADDWIEIYNPNATPVDLKGYVVSDSKTPHTISGSFVVPAEGYALLWADDSPAQGPNHLTFKLGASSGDSATISDPHGNQLDSVTFPADADKSSYARYPNGTGAFSWCDKPTPGASNGSACGVP